MSYVPGWEYKPDEVATIRAAQPIPTFGSAPANFAGDIPDHVFLWDSDRKVLGKLLEPKNQGQVGSCVSFGTNTAIRRTMLTEIMMGQAEEFKDIVEEVTYGGSRVEIGGGRLGGGDGSVGAWAAEFVKQWGVVNRGKHGMLDLSTYSESRCREFGRNGVPTEIEAIAKQHPVKAITQIKSWDEAKKALASGYGIAICSDRGFTTKRDSNGRCRPSGSWAHCMALDGYETSGGEYGHIENSWGSDMYSGPTGAGEPNEGSFWTDADTIDRMLRQDDSWAFSAVEGFPARKISWIL